MPVRAVLQWPHQILSAKAYKVDKIDDDVLNVINDLIDTCLATNALGVAAPQIGISLDIFVVNTAFLERSTQSMRVYINPHIVPVIDTISLTMAEGCLSIPNNVIDVQRFDQIRIEYTNLMDERVSEYHSGMYSRVLQHETDHLRGILLTDNLPKTKQAKLIASLRRHSG